MDSSGNANLDLSQIMQCIVTDLDSLSDDDRLVMNMDKGCQHLSVIKNIYHENPNFAFSLIDEAIDSCLC